ncbi:hypothetical protein PIB30_032323 [Stylosanthes scabra]|uniref:Uncharacterized protein n=1 Tax=Stylosanthes scabra TaxID=79078 RepID=A0ABU6RCE3_9FABA|nr:hypothetical protein [Stylosanthes scabra]
MGSGVIHYKYNKLEKFEDYDLKADPELGIFKTRHYNLMMNLSFILSIALDLTLIIRTRGLSSTQRVLLSSSTKEDSSFCRRLASKTLRSPKSWELIPQSKGWMCKKDEEEEEIGGMKPSIEKERVSKEEEEEEDLEREEDPEEEVPASTSSPVDIDATEDYLQFIECRIRPRIHQTVSLIVITLRVMIFLEFGNRHHRVRVFRVPRLVSI